MNFRSWLNLAALKLNNVPNPHLEAEILLSFVTKKSRSWILTFDKTIISKKMIKKLNFLIYRRYFREPIAYLIGKKYFWSLCFEVNKYTFIPRFDSELIIEKALSFLSKKCLNILDLGTGCGNLALSLAYERKDCFIIGIDNNKKAIYLAEKNAKNLKIKNIKFIYSNWFEKLKNNKFDMIISNPPYIDIQEKSHLMQDVKFEPYSSLFAYDKGLENIKYIIKKSNKYLNKNGYLLFEHGSLQGKEVRKIFKKNFFTKIQTFSDLSGYGRVSIAKINLNI